MGPMGPISNDRLRTTFIYTLQGRLYLTVCTETTQMPEPDGSDFRYVLDVGPIGS